MTRRQRGMEFHYASGFMHFLCPPHQTDWVEGAESALVDFHGIHLVTVSRSVLLHLLGHCADVAEAASTALMMVGATADYARGL